MTSPGSPTVDAHLEALDHPRKDEILRLRSAILAGVDGLDEHVKWNAPSFRFGGEDLVTFRLHPGPRVQLVLHRGARRGDPEVRFRVPDPEGLVEWRAVDRGVITVADADETAARQEAIVALVRLWVADAR